MKNYQEVSPKRLEEYNSIVEEVDKRAMALMSEEMGMPEDCCVMGGCHVFWKHKKRILRTETAAITSVGACMLYAETELCND